MDLPGTFELIDLRPAEHFADYSLPGSKNLHVADILSDPGYLVGAGPLILVDRDGSIAMAAGGILSQKTERPIKVLYGGLEAYWNENRGAFPAQGVFQKQAAPPATPPTSPAQTMPPPTQKPPEPPRRNAGC
jgi:hydroxyacylglutathione hydrolase